MKHTGIDAVAAPQDTLVPPTSWAGSPVAGWTVVGALWITMLITLPWWTPFATQHLLVEVFTVFAMALAWNLLAGYGGMVSVGQHAFVGVGAYAMFLCSNLTGFSPWWCVPVATLAGLVWAALSAWPMFRLSGPYFAVGSWVLAEVLRIGTLNVPALGAGGGMPLETTMDIDRWQRNAGGYWCALAVGLGSLAVAVGVMRSRIGLAVRAVADAPAAAAAAGVRVDRARLALWCIAGAVTATAGAVAYLNTLQVTPDACYSLNWTAAVMFIVVLGGVGSLEGPVLGTLLYFVLREVFADLGAWYFIVLGGLAMVMMVVAPGGLWSLVTRRWPMDVFGVRRRVVRCAP